MYSLMNFLPGDVKSFLNLKENKHEVFWYCKMNNSNKIFDYFYPRLLSEKVREKSEVIIISVAIISFILHLLMVY
jgi:hypothetical protein